MDHLAHCARQLSAFAALLDGDLSAPVRHCGRWDLYRLADHLGRDNLWAATAITEGRGDFRAPRADRNDLQAWFRSTSETLMAALALDPAAPAWTIYPPATVGFWRRRRAHETLIHRWDAEHALGLESSIDEELAADGVAEVLDTMLPRQLSLGRTEVPDGAIGFHAVGVATQWGTGAPAAVVSGTPQQLYLLLWGRLSLDDVAVAGDADLVRRFLAADLVP